MTEPDQAAAEVRTVHPPCTSCGAEDDHPRHIVIHSLVDDSLNKNLHFDCCVADGGCGTCEPVLAVAGDARGLDLLPHIAAVRAQEPADLNEGVPPVSTPQNPKG